MPKMLPRTRIKKCNSDRFVYLIDVTTREQAQSYLQQLFRSADELADHPKIPNAVEDSIGPAFTNLSLTVFPKMPDCGWNFEDEPRPQLDYGEKECEFLHHANALFRAVYDEEKPRYQQARA